MSKENHLAVLIDGDNIPAGYLKVMLEEIAKYGNPTMKRIYGDWTRPNLNHWKKRLLDTAIVPIQQYSYTSGKNATDSAMIIDAMDILYSGKVDGFCLVSSDSDFTRLATRLREAGMHVIGIGEKKTPQPFMAACDRFVYLEVLRKDADEAAETDNGGVDRVTPKVVELIAQTIDDCADDDGWAFMGDVGSLLQKKQPNFDARNYGFQKLTPLIDSIGKFTIESRESPQGRHKLIYVKK